MRGGIGTIVPILWRSEGVPRVLSVRVASKGLTGLRVIKSAKEREGRKKTKELAEIVLEGMNARVKKRMNVKKTRELKERMEMMRQEQSGGAEVE